MPQDGYKVLAHWREVGAWWAGEPQKEFIQYRDLRGVKREKHRLLNPLRQHIKQKDYTDNNQEDYVLRPRKLRDEKVAIACGADVSLPMILPALSQATPYVPLHVWSGYSLGRSVLFARELPRRAAALGLPAIALVDRFSLSGAVELAREAKSYGIKPLIGATMEMGEGGHIVLIAKNDLGYVNLSRLLTECHLQEPRLFPLCTWERLSHFSEGLLCLTGGDDGIINRPLMRRDYGNAQDYLHRLIHLYGQTNVFVEIERSYSPWQRSLEPLLLELAKTCGVQAVAGGCITHAEPSDYPAQDIVICIQTLCQIEEVVGRKPLRHPSQPQIQHPPLRSLNTERYLRSPQQMAELFRDRPDLLENTLLVADKVEPDVLPKRPTLPELLPNQNQFFQELVMTCTRDIYGAPTPSLRNRIRTEMNRILTLDFVSHFLIMWDLCRWAKSVNIQLSGRGSVVDSVISYLLGFSRIDAHHHNLHFDRFLPADGSKRPDIDIDFEAKRRDDVRNYLITKYGTEHVAMVCAFGAYCTRGIMREAGKVLGLDPDVITYIAKRMHRGIAPDQIESAIQRRPELRNTSIDSKRLKWLFELGSAMMDVPRSIGTHSSGVIISAQPIRDIVPVMWSASEQEGVEGPSHLRMIQWDKRSAKHYFDKFDILCLRGQDVLSGTERRIRQTQPDFDVQSISSEDPEPYRAMRSGELIGIPQSASPAMRQAHMRIETQNLADASLVQAGIRPGVGGAVKINELIARRRGTKLYAFEHPDLEAILGNTYGIIVFQEQVDLLLQTFAGYSGGEAEDIRDAIHKRRREDFGQTIKRELVERIVKRGYSSEVAEHVFQLIAGFKGYGFAQGHALAFAEISIRSIYCQQNYPAEYFASLLDAQPAGYYGPCTLANEARNRGVKVLPPCVNRSTRNFVVESVTLPSDPLLTLPNSAFRVSLSQIKGLSRTCQERIIQSQPYGSFFEFVRRTRPNQDELQNLILCGACDELSTNRRAMLWALPEAYRWADSKGGALDLSVKEPELDYSLEDFSQAEKSIRERMLLDLDIKDHLMAYERTRVSSRGGLTTQKTKKLPHGKKAVVVGHPIRLRFPPTPSGRKVMFFDLEDETGLLNVTCFNEAYEKYGHAIICSPYVTLIGQSQWRDGHTAFLVQAAFEYHPVITQLVQWQPEELGVVADFLVG
jgi:error-prone DNA polymerase